MNQTTIKEPFILRGGIGLHSGEKSDLFFSPAEADHGIVFYRRDKDVAIPATYKFSKPSPLCTTIENRGVEVHTIEHLLSVCNGLGIDNLTVELSCPEVPIWDGSGYPFYKAIKGSGLRQLDTPKKVVKILETITYQQGEITIFLSPSQRPEFTFSIDFDHEQIGQQEFSFQLTEKSYVEHIVKAKTFGFRKDYDRLKNQGLIKGGSDKNAIILDESGSIENIETMTWLNEPNLHKLLDQIGDFYLADNRRIIGNAFSHKSGHTSHVEFITYMMDECHDKYVIQEDI